MPDPRDAPRLRWGILGTGWIAERFVAALQQETDQEVAAVGSRSEESAAAFSGRFGIPTAHGSYEELVADPSIDVVYVATPHTAHLPHASLALDAGKHILVEKPVALNVAEAGELAARAAERGLYCAEAMWTLFTPKFDVIRQLIDERVLGDVHAVISDFGEWFTADHRIMRADLAGGPLLDLGTYPLSLAHWVLGAPTEIIARGEPAPSGVNGQTSALLVHRNGAHSVITTSILANSPTGATIAGSEATVTIPGIYYRPGPFVLESADKSRRLEYREPEVGYDALAYEAAETARRIGAGETGTPIRPMADAIATLQILDEVRRQIGVVFDAER